MNIISDFDLSQIFEKLKLSCPTCGLKCNGQICCRRCHTDLTLLMKTATQAWKLRNRARCYLLAGEFEKSIHYVSKAQTLHKTSFGNLLKKLATYGLANSSDQSIA